MKLVSMRLKNFRCFKNEFTVNLDALTTFVAKNDAGKSSLFQALEIFFNGGVPDQGDASVDGDNTDVCITGVFDGLPDSVVLDADYQTTLESEHLLTEMWAT